MGKSLVVMEPRREIASSMVLSGLNKLRNFLEVYLWAMPPIGRIENINRQLVIVSPEAPLAKDVSRRWGDYVIDRVISRERFDCVVEHSARLAREWYLYRELPEFLQIGPVDIGNVLQNAMWYRVFPLFRQVELADTLLEEVRPDIVYIESTLFPSGRAFKAVADFKGIKCVSLEPTVWLKLKDLIRSYIDRRKFKEARKPRLYSIPHQRLAAPQYTILVYAPYVNFFSAVHPAMEELVNEKSCKQFLIGRKSFVPKILREAKEVNIRNGNVAEYTERSKRIREYYHSELERDVRFQELFAYKGVSLWEVLKADIGRLFDSIAFDVIYSIAYFKMVINEIGPDIVVVGYDRNTIVSGLVMLAREMGIPVLEIQHGLHRPIYPATEPLSDKIAAGGDYSKESYKRLGARDGQVVVTGWPKYDRYKKLKEDTSRKSATEILFAMGPGNTKANLYIIKSIGLWLKDFERIRLIVKPHPSESEKVYRKVTNEYEQVTLCKSGEDIASILPSTDVMITEHSTVGTEAALLDIPIVRINITSKESQSVYVTSGIAIEARNVEELKSAIKDALYNEEVRGRLTEARKRFVYDHAYLQDGQASKRVANLIVRMIEESRESKNESWHSRNDS